MRRKIDSIIFDVHAQFGGNMEDMQRRLDQGRFTNWLERVSEDGITNREVIVTYATGAMVAIAFMGMGYLLFVL